MVVPLQGKPYKEDLVKLRRNHCFKSFIKINLVSQIKLELNRCCTHISVLRTMVPVSKCNFLLNKLFKSDTNCVRILDKKTFHLPIKSQASLIKCLLLIDGTLMKKAVIGIDSQ